MKPVPDNVKEILTQLSGPHQVTLRSYIATLRAEIKQLEEDLLNAKNPDPHAHYHGKLGCVCAKKSANAYIGHEKCTADHGHAEHKHNDDDHHHHHEHKKEAAAKDTTPHDHDHEHSAACEHHDHGHKDHKEEESHHHKHDHAAGECCNHDHADQHHEHKTTEHHTHEHQHGNDEEMPDWKKRALDADPNAAPFGGSWNTESNVSASEAASKMEE